MQEPCDDGKHVYDPSGIGHRASGIGHRASGIGHRASGIGCLGVILAVTSTAPGQSQPTYKLVDLGTHGNANDEESRAYGVNIFGQVVGQTGVYDTGRGEIDERAFLWLPTGIPHLGQGMHNLDPVPGGLPSIALDINDKTHVVGGVGQGAFIWAAAAFDAVPARSIHGIDQFGVARAITNATGDHQWVVGLTPAGDPCDRGFVWKSELDQVDDLLAGAPHPIPGKGWARTEATSINPGALEPGASGFAVVGVSEECFAGDTCPDPVRGASLWMDVTDPADRLPLPLDPMGMDQDTLSEARDVNDDEISVGWWEDPQACALKRAMRWEGDSAVVDLHLQAGLTADESFAEAINLAGEIVGWERGPDRAVSLVEGAQGWAVTDLTAEISSNCNFVLIEAHDINEQGWIVGWGEDGFAPDEQFDDRAFLLIPVEDIPCPEDVNRDGIINDDDVDLIINTLNQPCPPGRICWEDVNHDCVPTMADVKMVMRAYGPCSGTGTQLSQQDVDIWAAFGGEAEIHDGTITSADLGASLSEPTPGERLLSLYELLAQ